LLDRNSPLMGCAPGGREFLAIMFFGYLLTTGEVRWWIDQTFIEPVWWLSLTNPVLRHRLS